MPVRGATRFLPVLLQVVPWNHDIEAEQGWYDGLFISNGPGDPAMCRWGLGLQIDNHKGASAF